MVTGSAFESYCLTCSGAKGTRTPGLLHAMQALYQLSYSPSAAASTRQQRHASVQDLRRSAVVAENRFGQCSGVVLHEPPPAAPTAEDRPGAVGQWADRTPQFFGESEQTGGTQAQRCSVADHYREGPRRQGIGDPFHRGAGPVGDGCGGLTLGGAPLGMLHRVTCADFGVGEPFPQSAVTLAQVLVQSHGEPGEPGQWCCRGGSADQVGGEDRARLQGGEQPGSTLCLLLAGLIEGDVGLALEPALHVPLGLPMPPRSE